MPEIEIIPPEEDEISPPEALELLKILRNNQNIKIDYYDTFKRDRQKHEKQWYVKFYLENPDDTFFIEFITREFRGEEYIIGIELTVFRDSPDKDSYEAQGTIFIPRKPGQTIEEFARAIEQIYSHTKEIQMEHGEVSTVKEGIRKYMTEIGVFEENPRHKRRNGNPPRFKVPEAKRGRSKITAVNQSDSFGKTRWRKTLVDQFYKMCPGGYESLPEDERSILCFPGVGKEAEMWKKLGFQNEDFVFIERDEELAQRLEKRYPGATVICKHLKK